MSNVSKRPEIKIFKKLHRYKHENKKELTTLFKEAGMFSSKIEKSIEKVTAACIPCALSGRPTNSKKLSLKHINKKFNIKVQAYVLTLKAGHKKYEALNVINLST